MSNRGLDVRQKHFLSTAKKVYWEIKILGENITVIQKIST